MVGSYERADRAISATGLAELATFYHASIAELLPDSARFPHQAGEGRVRFDLERLALLTTFEAGPLIRYLQSIRVQRGDYNSSVLTIRAADLRALGIVYDTTPDVISQRFTTWGVLCLDGDGLRIPTPPPHEPLNLAAERSIA